MSHFIALNLEERELLMSQEVCFFDVREARDLCICNHTSQKYVRNESLSVLGT